MEGGDSPEDSLTCRLTLKYAGETRAQTAPRGFLRVCRPHAQTHTARDSGSGCRIPTGPCPLGIICAIVFCITVCLLCSMRAEA